MGYDIVIYGDPMCVFKKCVVIKGGDAEDFGGANE